MAISGYNEADKPPPAQYADTASNPAQAPRDRPLPAFEANSQAWCSSEISNIFGVNDEQFLAVVSSLHHP
jgi:hypothetical protein